MNLDKGSILIATWVEVDKFKMGGMAGAPNYAAPRYSREAYFLS
jgi:hypothetical protein|tara:strand:+ start:9388 stop:9519 length:132 start_codon:yes stop_codon:yes gene_type:complete